MGEEGCARDGGHRARGDRVRDGNRARRPVVGPRRARTAPAASAASAATTGAVAKAETTSFTAPAAYTPPARNLAVGMSGADVKALQQRLSAAQVLPGHD